MMRSRPDLQALPLGFDDPVSGAQLSFRCALRALSHPGEVVQCPVSAPEVQGLMPATVALLLALTDHETPVWWARQGPEAWLRFHTGAPVAPHAAAALFAVLPLQHARATLDLAAFCAGTDLSPEQSTTLLVELPTLSGGPAVMWAGPGLQRPRMMEIAGLPEDFWPRWQDNHARFPRGVDVFFICGQCIVGLPRSTLATPIAVSAAEAT